MVANPLKDQVIVYPTDSVWGIGGNIYSRIVYEEILKIKKITERKPFTLLFTNVEMLEEYFLIDAHLLKEKIIPMAGHEVTYAISKSFINKELPDWCLYNSSSIFFRYLPDLGVKKICSKLNTPLFTTSLNFTGDDIILDESMALDFFNNNIKDGQFIPMKGQEMSGVSSTILKFDENYNCSFLRVGRYEKELRSAFNFE